MKPHFIDRLFTIIAYNVYIIPQLLFSLSLFITFIFSICYGSVPLIVGYLFWFSFGFFSFSLIIKKTTSYLKRKYEDNDEYYHSLLDKREKKL